MRRAFAISACASLLACTGLAGTAAAWPNPVNDPRVLNDPIEDSTYDLARRCKPRTTPGIRLLTGWIDRHFIGESWGVYRCQRLDKDSRSLHSEGRALDWHLDAKNKRERRAANFLIERLLATDELGNTTALARRMGVQEIIFNCRSWSSGSDGLGDYEACDAKNVDRTTAHRDHVHIGLNLAGANARTSFWRSGLGKK